MRKTLLALCIILSTHSWAGEEKKSVVVNFGHDQHELTEKEKSKLQELVEQVDLLNDYQIRLSGHTDNSGTHTYNDVLSLKRAEEVKAYLITEGIGPESISFDYHGERKPIEKNDGAEKMRKNRRVEVTYSTYYFENENDLLDSLSFGYKDEFIIDPSDFNELHTDHGLTLNIDPMSFVNDNGELVESDVKIKVEQGSDFNSFIAHDLMTLSDDRMIESDGMFYISAESMNGEELQLDEGMPIQASLETGEMKSNMELFVSEDGQNWNSTGPIVQTSARIKLSPPKISLISIPDFTYKKFVVDKKTMPKPPKKPVIPRNPHEPRMESYQSRDNFWTFLFPKRAQEKANERYLEAMDKYLDKVGKYEVRMANYLHSKERYDDRMEAYKKEYNVWLEEQRRLADIDYSEQVKKYEVAYADEIAENQRRRELFKQDQDLYRQKYLKARAQQMDDLGSASLSNADRYTFAVTRMGYINCDRFIKTEERILAVWDNDESDEIVRLLFPARNGLMNLTRLNGDDFYNLNYQIPGDEEMIVFALKVVDGRPHIFFHKVKEDEKNIEMHFTETRFSDLKGILEDITETKTAMID